MGWTEQQVREYTQRRLRQEEPARRKMQDKFVERVAEERQADAGRQLLRCIRTVRDKLPPRSTSKTPKAHEARYSLPVVLAFFKEMGLPEPVPEYRFDPTRKWRFDFAFVNAKLALEIQGSIFSGGRHTRGAALLKEYEKLSNAAIQGWRVMFFIPSEICMTNTAEMIRQAL
jgi:hypothetical protein